MAGELLLEAFRELDDLEETTFEVDDEGVKKVEANLMVDEDDSVEVYDENAEDEEELEGSYVGRVIVDCPVCHSKLFKEPLEIEVSDEGEVVNVGSECPYCMQVDGYKIIGQVSEYEGTEDAEDVEGTEEVEEVEEADSSIDESISSLAAAHKLSRMDKKGLNPDATSWEKDAWQEERDELEAKAELGGALTKRVMKRREDRAARQQAAAKAEAELKRKQVTDEMKKRLGLDDHEFDEYLKSAGLVQVNEAKKRGSRPSVLDRLKKAGVNIGESVGTDIGEYQKWVDYDMERYGRVSGVTLSKLKKAGLTVVKDKYGELEVIAREPEHDKKLRESKDTLATESVQSVNVETDDAYVEVKPEEDGAITVKAGERDSDLEGEEAIVPVTDETIEEIEEDEGTFEEDESTFEEEESTEPEEEEELTEFDEEEIDELGESYLKRVYENVDSFKTTSGAVKGNKIRLEGVIKFKSGKKMPTAFVFEKKEVTKTGKCRFLGENKALSGNSKAFTLTGRIEGGKLMCESLRYNYQAKDAKTGKSTRMSGSVRLGTKQ